MCTIDCVSVKEKWTPSKNDLGNIADVCRHIIMIKFIPGIYVYSCNEVSATSDEATMNLRRHAYPTAVYTYLFLAVYFVYYQC